MNGICFKNFAATQILEDNIISQLKSLNRSTVLLGDDTWVKLLPDTFTETFEMDSFDVKDLDLVDSTIKRTFSNSKHMFHLLAKLFEQLQNKNFTLLVSHFLGVDHCGHRYGPSHPEMRRKLNEMDDIIANVIDHHLDERTILFVFGDHGMTETGDHGGDAIMEVEAALFVYSKKPLPSISNDYLTISQIDLLPTISLLLDIPVPFSNLGAIIEDIFDKKTVGTAWKLNVEQVVRYASSYNVQNPAVQVIL